MAILDRCPLCDQLRFDWKTHRCPPAFAVWLDDEVAGYTEADASTIYARDAHTAAEIFASQHDAGDYELLNGRTIDVCVRELTDSDRVHHYRVRGELVPEYIAE